MYQSEPRPTEHDKPEPIAATDWVPTFWNSSFGQISRALSPATYVKRYTGGPRALDVNAFGKVPDSTWFQNRITRRKLSVAEIQRGPNLDPPPATEHLIVERGTTGGVTPGFYVVDARGQAWVIKFDHPGFPGLSSGAEVVATKLLYAAGYHVPQNHVANIDIKALKLGKHATTRDDYNRTVPFTRVALDEALDQLNPSPSGQLRAMFSRVLPGSPLGPFSLRGIRPDDPNDTIPHERRRSLRGLWLFYAWLNNTDAKYTNSLDVFIETDRDQGHIEHYLIDFGTSLGATPEGPKAIKEGYEYRLDWPEVAQRAVTLGIQYPYWSTVKRAPQRSVGTFEGEVFDPARWHPVWANVAFDAADRLDTFWAGSILAHFGPLEIAAAVSAGEYNEPGAAEVIAAILVQRRDKLLRFAFSGLTPLDDPTLSSNQELELTDLEVLAGLESPKNVEYRWVATWHGPGGKSLGISAKTTPRPALQLAPLLAWVQRQPAVASKLEEFPFFTITWQRRRTPEANFGPSLETHLRLLADGTPIVVGVDRDLD